MVLRVFREILLAFASSLGVILGGHPGFDCRILHAHAAGAADARDG